MESAKVSKISRAYGETISVLSFFGIVPYKWCKLHQRLQYQPFQAPWMVFLGLAAVLQDVFSLWQAIRGFSNRHSIDLITLTRKFFIAFGFNISNINFYTILKDPPLHAALVNDMIRTAHRYYGKNLMVTEFLKMK